MSEINFAKYRAAFDKKIARVRQQKFKTEGEIPCQHDNKLFKETIRPDNDKFIGSAYFVVKVCIKCKLKRTIHLKIDKWA